MLEKLKNSVVRVRTVLVVFTAAVVVLIAVFSIYKKQHSSSVHYHQHSRRISQTKQNHSNQSHAEQNRAENHVRTVQPRKTSTSTDRTDIAVSSPNQVYEEISEVNKQLYLLRAKNKLLQEQIKFYENQERLKELKNKASLPAITIERPSETEVLREQIRLLQEEIRKLREEKRTSTKKSLKEALKKSLENLLSPRNYEHYTLLAIVGNRALLKDRKGNEFWVRDGEKLNGEKVKVGDFSVFIGNREVPLKLTGNSSKLLNLPLPNNPLPHLGE